MNSTHANKLMMLLQQALQKLKHGCKQWLDHESLFWILPLAFFLLLGVELLVILSRLY